MRRIASRVALLVASHATVGCFPSFDGLTGSPAPKGDASPDASCHGTACPCDARECTEASRQEASLEDASNEALPLTPAGTALRFSGAQLMRIAPGPTDDVTIEMWIKTTQYAETDVWFGGGVLYHADAPGVANDLGAAIVTDRFAFGIGNPDMTVVSKTAVNTGQWFHVAATRVKATGVIRIYVNGNDETIATSPNTGSLSDAPAPWVGGFGQGRSTIVGYVGTVDELRLWNVARTGTEIASAMRERLRGDEPGLVGCWHFDEGQGTTAADSSPLHNDGALGYGYPERVPDWVRSDAPIVSSE